MQPCSRPENYRNCNSARYTANQPPEKTTCAIFHYSSLLYRCGAAPKFHRWKYRRLLGLRDTLWSLTSTEPSRHRTWLCMNHARERPRQFTPYQRRDTRSSIFLLASRYFKLACQVGFVRTDFRRGASTSRNPERSETKPINSRREYSPLTFRAAGACPMHTGTPRQTSMHTPRLAFHESVCSDSREEIVKIANLAST